MGIFRFKRFSVKNERSAMKVNTDGVLLGASMTIMPSDMELLDIGTGTGTVALIAAQRLYDLQSGTLPASAADFLVQAIDIDLDSASEAAENFAESPWSGNLLAENISLDGLELRLDAGDGLGACDCGMRAGTAVGRGGTGRMEYDFIFSNPPYFESSLKAPDERRRAARHAETMSYRDIVDFSSRHLKANGRLSMILPAEVEQDLLRYAASGGLFPFRILRIKSVPRKEPYRIMAEFSRVARDGEAEEGLLVIQDGGRYTEEYCSVTHEFLLYS
ncbi:MAG: hypothetical protein K2O58_04300 [Bacteroidales bacterium]|nr:hypothetical protein [Bacteroidales bacterium]